MRTRITFARWWGSYCAAVDTLARMQAWASPERIADQQRYVAWLLSKRPGLRARTVR